MFLPWSPERVACKAVLADIWTGDPPAKYRREARTFRLSAQYRIRSGCAWHEGLQEATQANAKIQAQVLRELSPVLAELTSERKLLIVPAFFDVETGEVILPGQ